MVFEDTFFSFRLCFCQDLLLSAEILGPARFSKFQKWCFGQTFQTRVRTSKLHLSNCDWKTLETATARRPRSHHSIWSWRLETQATCFWSFPCIQPSKLAVQSPLRQSEVPALKPEPRTGCSLASFATLLYIFCRAVGCLSCLPLWFFDHRKGIIGHSYIVR